jgi:NADH-quinone oxidoreductase subunit G
MGFVPSHDLVSELKDKTVYILAADPAGDDPALAEALKTAKTLIVQDILETATTRLVGIVLPAAAYTEREGTYTSAERRVQRFYPAVPAKPGTRADFALVAELAQKCGIELEGRSPLLVMNQLSASEPAFSGVSYTSLSEVTEQWPIVGRGDLYYGGTSYENKLGLGVTLERATHAFNPSTGSGQAVQRSTFNVLRPKEDELMAVPVTRLYDFGNTVAPAKLLSAHIDRFNGIVLNPITALKLGLDNGSQAEVSLNGVSYPVKVLLDASISTGVVLIPRSMGIPIPAPAPVKVLSAQKA